MVKVLCLSLRVEKVDKEQRAKELRSKKQEESRRSEKSSAMKIER